MHYHDGYNYSFFTLVVKEPRALTPLMVNVVPLTAVPSWVTSSVLKCIRHIHLHNRYNIQDLCIPYSITAPV